MLKGNKYSTTDPKWDNIVLGTLPDTYIANSSDLLWAVDAERRLIFANDAYIDYIYQTTGVALQVDEYSTSPDGNQAMTDKWDYFYTRALAGERFHIITNLASKSSAMIVDANFIPLVSDDHVLGTACLARSTASMLLPSVEQPTQENEHISFNSRS